ncbi:MAG: shikimate kinase [Acutalibacteraceae bacterium]
MCTACTHNSANSCGIQAVPCREQPVAAAAKIKQNPGSMKGRIILDVRQIKTVPKTVTPNVNIVLCGFMGSGKTTVGRILSKSTGLELIDMDEYIEKKQDMTVSEIFAKYGEEYFRDLEHKAALELSKKQGCIISAGGGTLVYKRNVDAFKKGCKIVLLDVPLEVIKERLKNDTKRPLLQRPDKNKAMKELYDKRMPLYKQAAQYTVTAARSPYAAARQIERKFFR